MRLRFAACLVAMVSIFGACGGRLISTETDGQSGGSSSRGGSHASGATSNTGATNSVGATGSYGATGTYGGSVSAAGMSAFGGTASGGFVGTGGATTGGCACVPLACPPSYVAVPNPDGCCYHCESLCNQMACPAIGCPSGSHLDMTPGQCCPTCVQDGCDQQQAIYQDFKRQLVEKYSSYGCKTASDCTIYWEKNQCGAGCGFAVSSAAVGNLDTNLQSYAQQVCSPSCPFLIQACDAPAGPFCFNGRCQ